MAYKLIFRHGLVSLVSGTIEYSSFLFLFKFLELNLVLSYASSFALATSFGFIAHSYFTFRVGALQSHRAGKFLLQASGALLLGFCILKILLNFSIPAYIAKGLQLALTFSFNILVGRYVSFKT